MKKLFLLILSFGLPLYSYEFRGIHYMASYKGCSAEMKNTVRLYCYFLCGIEECGATIISHRMDRFSPISMTGMAILSESHASIHTYPEHKSVFVDLFTCGDHCDWLEFEKVMVNYLKPRCIERRVVVRE